MTGSARPSVRQITVPVGELRLRVRVAGRGPALVLLHGFPQTSTCWRRVLPDLARTHTVIAPDLRGLGDSDRPSAGYDKVSASRDVLGLLDRLEIDRAAVVGHDLGGWVAYPLAAHHPDRVTHLALLEAVVPGHGLESQIAQFWHFGFHAAPDVPEALVTGRERLYLDHFFGLATYDRTAITADDVDEYVRCYSAPGALRAAFSYYRTLRQDAEDNSGLPRLTMPVLALGGQYAQADEVVESARRVADDVTGGTVPECGHWIPDERPDHLVDELHRLLDR